MSKAWSHLPNASHIDWVFNSVKENPELWVTAKSAARDAAWAAAWDAARTSIAALIAWDDCDQFLNMPYEKLQVWAVLSEDPRAILLLPMVNVKEQSMNLSLQFT